MVWNLLWLHCSWLPVMKPPHPIKGRLGGGKRSWKGLCFPSHTSQGEKGERSKQAAMVLGWLTFCASLECPAILLAALDHTLYPPTCLPAKVSTLTSHLPTKWYALMVVCTQSGAHAAHSQWKLTATCMEPHTDPWLGPELSLWGTYGSKSRALA